MAFTYSGNPADSDRDTVRFLIGDTDQGDALLQDAEIAYLLETHGSALSAAIYAVDGLIAKYARGVDRTIGRLSIRNSSRLAQFRLLRDSLAARQSAIGVPYAGGISEADKSARVANSDRPLAAFAREHRYGPYEGPRIV